MLKLKTYEDQAKLSVLLGLIGLLAAFGAIVAIAYAFRADGFFTLYRPGSFRLPAIAGGVLLGLAGGGGAFLLGLLTAGQRRNKAIRLSWTGFFLGAGAMTLAMSAGLFFYLTRQAINA